MMRIAEIYLRQEKFKESTEIAERLTKNSDDSEIKVRAERLAADITQRQEMLAEYEARRKKYEEDGARPSGGERIVLRRKPGEEKPTPEQLAKATEAANIRALNQSLRQPQVGEIRTLGKITKIDCKGSGIGYSIKTETDSFQVASKDFQSLVIMTYVADDIADEIGCDAKLEDINAVISYKPSVAKPGVRGDLVAVEFVPHSFRFIDLDKEPAPTTYIVEETVEPSGGAITGRTPPPLTAGDMEERRRAMMMKSIADSLRKPGAGEVREMGFVDHSECTNKGIFFYIRVGTRILKLTNETPQAMLLRTYTPDVASMQIGCDMKSVEIPVVFVYKTNTDTKAKIAGDLLSLEFVPPSFRLEP
jgi:hypothetical protein